MAACSIGVTPRESRVSRSAPGTQRRNRVTVCEQNKMKCVGNHIGYIASRTCVVL